MPQTDGATLASSQRGQSSEASHELHEMIRLGGSWSGHERNCCFLNTGQVRFADVSSVSGFDYFDDSRSISLVDWDLDGDLDAWLCNRSGPQIRFLENQSTTTTGGFVLLRLQGRESNRDAIGSRIELTVENAGHTSRRIRSLRAGEAYQSQASKWVHFGLEQGGTVQEVSVRWPNGNTETYDNLRSQGRYVLVEGSGVARAWNYQQQSTRSAAVALPPLPKPEGGEHVMLAHPLPLPELLNEDKHGSVLSLHQHAGRPLLLTLWASWCHPCLKELSSFVEHETQLRDAGINILALSVAHLDAHQVADAPEPQDILTKLKFPFSAGKATAETVEKLQVAHDHTLGRHDPLPLPCSFLIDRDGRLMKIYKGAIGVTQLLDDLRLVTDGESMKAALAFAGRWANEPSGRRYLDFVGELLVNGYLREAVAYIQSHQAVLAQNEEEYARLLNFVGEKMIGANQHHAAQGFLLEALRRSPALAEALVNLSVVEMHQGNTQAAQEHLQKAVQLAPELDVAHFNLAILLEAAGRTQEAEAHLRHALNSNSQLAEAHHRLAIILEESGRVALAIEHYDRAIEYGNGMPESCNNLAWLLATHPDDKIRDGARALQLASTAANAVEHPSVLDTLAAAHAEMGQFGRAQQAAQRALRLATIQQQPALVREIQSHLAQYRLNKPIRTPAFHESGPR